MNIFCHPETLNSPIRQFLGVPVDATPIFGYKPGTPLKNGRRDTTEIDMELGDLLIEAKLTEYGFQTAPARLIVRYKDFEEVFHLNALELVDGRAHSYQLIRGALAAYASPEARFCVLCDARRPDLIDSWHTLLLAVKPHDLRCRLQVLTWQELAAELPDPLQCFLMEKYGIFPAARRS